MSTLGWFRMALVAPLLFAPLAHAAAGSDGWEQLKSLAGEWEGRMADGPGVARVSYRVIANGSAVVESMNTGDPSHDMITVYHQDGDKLMVTHYCASGNQPRLKADPKLAAGKRLEFRFLDATNLSGPDATHMRDLTMTFPDTDHMVQEWTYRNQGKDQKMVFRYTRAPAAK